MIALWPDDRNPTHLIFCNEQGVNNPGVQRVRLADGSVETILTGTTSCDPAHRTPWGTIIVGEEATDGNVIEIINPLATTNIIFNRVTGATSGASGPQMSSRGRRSGAWHSRGSPSTRPACCTTETKTAR